jgi:hypothetical protein
VQSTPATDISGRSKLIRFEKRAFAQSLNFTVAVLVVRRRALLSRIMEMWTESILARRNVTSWRAIGNNGGSAFSSLSKEKSNPCKALPKEARNLGEHSPMILPISKSQLQT